MDVPTAARTRLHPVHLLAYGLIIVAAGLPRVRELGGFVTVDEQARWIQRVNIFMQALASGMYGATAITEHPGVTTLWLGTIGTLLRRALERGDLVEAPAAYAVQLALLRLPVVLVHTAGVVLGYHLLRRLVPPMAALLAALLWACDPFVIAYSRVLHVDGLTGTFATVSLLAACVYWQHVPQLRWLSCSAISAGLAIVSKSPGLVLIPAVGGLALLAWWRLPDDSQRPLRLVKPVLLWGVLCLATIVACWPALWVNPVRAYQQIQQGISGVGSEPHEQGNFFLGRPDEAPGVLFYPVAIALRLTPITLLGLLALPLAWRRLRWLNRADLAALAWYVLLFTLALTFFPKKFNRYLVPAFPALDVLAAVGLVWMAELPGQLLSRVRSGNPVPRRVGPAVVLVVAACLAAVNAAWWHPYSLAAFNQLLGGARAGERAFLVGWGEGFEQVAAWLNQQPDITSVLTVTPIDHPLQPYLKHGAQAYTPKQGEQPQQAGYVVVYVRYIQNGAAAPPFDRYWGTATPLQTVVIHGVPYAWIYHAVPAVTHPVPATFGPTIRLRGLVTPRSATRGVPLAIRLVWEAPAQPAQDSLLFVHLLGPQGQRVAQADVPLATSGWQPGRSPVTELPLVLPATAPTGHYQLVGGLYDPTTGQRLPVQSPAVVDPALDGAHALLLATIEVR